MHTLGIIHRDLKPVSGTFCPDQPAVKALPHCHQLGLCMSQRRFDCIAQENLLLSSEGHIKVTDFGLAKANMTHESRTNSFIGTMVRATSSCLCC